MQCHMEMKDTCWLCLVWMGWNTMILEDIRRWVCVHDFHLQNEKLMPNVI